MMKPSIPLGLAATVLAAALLPAQSTLKAGWYTDKTLGFKVKVPSKWRQIPTQPDEQWVVALFQSDRDYANEEGYIQKLLMRVIMFDKNVGKKEGEQDTKVIRFGRTLRYRNYKDFVKQTQGGGGFYFSVEKERTSGTPATMYEVKFEKLTHAKRRIAAWEFKQQDVSFAVEFEVFEEHYKKLRPAIDRTFRSFRFVESEASEASETSPPAADIPDRKEWKKLSSIERHKRRLALEEEQEKKLLEKLPKDWKVIKTKHFLVISHADQKFTKAIITAGDACWDWLEKRFGQLSDEYVRRSIIRICKDEDEYRAYHSGSGGWFSIRWGSFSREVSELQFYDGEILRDQTSYLMRNLLSHYLTDKDDTLLGDAPDWLQTGLGGYLAGTVLKGRKVVFEPTVDERVAIAKLIQAGGFREGKLKTVREIMSMTDRDWSDLEKKESSKGGSKDESPFSPSSYQSQYQMTHLVRFLEGAGRRHKLLEGKDFLVDYCRAAKAVSDEYDEKNPRKGVAQKEAQTEEEEERQAAERKKQWKEMAEGASEAERAKLKILNGKMANWTDEEWESLQKAYARTCRK